MARLSGEDISGLSELLTSTLDFNSLSLYVHASTGDRLFNEYVPQGMPLRPTIVNLLNALEDRGTTCHFLHRVYKERPYRTDVRESIISFCPNAATQLPGAGIELSAQHKGAVQPQPPVAANAPGFERNVRPHLTKVDVRVWLTRLAAIERCVCRVELDGDALGTGFLVGPNAVLTNWHVVERPKALGKLDRVGCRFDYVLLGNGARQPGGLVSIAGLIDSSPYSPAETTAQPEFPPPTPDQLDYALLRLADATGKQVVDGSERGWLPLPEAAPALEPGAPMLIVQHPDGAPMKLALDTEAVIAFNGNATRVRYNTNTEPGSSGSPCFTMDWDLAALHHYGDPAWQAPKFNQGVPIGLVRQRIVARGFGDALGA